MTNNTNWIPIAISETDYDRPEVKENLAEIVCEIFGMPINESTKAKALSIFKMQPRTNVIGSVEYDVPAGSNWYVSSDAIKNLLGDNITQAEAKLQATKLKPKQGTPLIGEITPFGEEWFKEWGIVSQDVAEVLNNK